MLSLYQFPISHYCEKIRRALDYEKLDYRVVNLLPGFHASTAKRILLVVNSRVLIWLSRRLLAPLCRPAGYGLDWPPAYPEPLAQFVEELSEKLVWVNQLYEKHR